MAFKLAEYNEQSAECDGDESCLSSLESSLPDSSTIMSTLLSKDTAMDEYIFEPLAELCWDISDSLNGENDVDDEQEAAGDTGSEENE